MSKQNYFDLLEQLSLLCTKAVHLHSSGERGRALREISRLENEANVILSDIEERLFKDFMPVLERSSIAASAHAICRVIDLCLIGAGEGEVADVMCFELAQRIKTEVFRIRRIKKSNELPDRNGFRSAFIRLCASSKKPSRASLLLAEELCLCFDRTVEVMLKNI